jgi:hypothetical protein
MAHRHFAALAQNVEWYLDVTPRLGTADVEQKPLIRLIQPCAFVGHAS